jgi:hypothetical protein
LDAKVIGISLHNFIHVRKKLKFKIILKIWIHGA